MQEDLEVLKRALIAADMDLGVAAVQRLVDHDADPTWILEEGMAVAMFDLWGNGQGPELAALGLLWSLAMTAVALVFYAVARRAGIGLHGQG